MPQLCLHTQATLGQRPYALHPEVTASKELLGDADADADGAWCEASDFVSGERLRSRIKTGV